MENRRIPLWPRSSIKRKKRSGRNYWPNPNSWYSEGRRGKNDHGIGGQLKGIFVNFSQVRDEDLLLRRRPSSPSSDQLPSTAHNSLVTRLRSILIFYGNQVRHLTESTPHPEQVSSENLGDEALTASPSTTDGPTTTCQMKGHKLSRCPEIGRPLEGHVDDWKT